jgi:hypothetical protein
LEGISSKQRLKRLSFLREAALLKPNGSFEAIGVCSGDGLCVRDATLVVCRDGIDVTGRPELLVLRRVLPLEGPCH